MKRKLSRGWKYDFLSDSTLSHKGQIYRRGQLNLDLIKTAYNDNRYFLIVTICHVLCCFNSHYDSHFANKKIMLIR